MLNGSLEFIKRCEERDIPIHGFMAVQGGRVLAEHYFWPFDESSLHRMFSVTKSFTSIAVGFLAADSLIGLDEKICTYFPEYVDDNTHPWIKEMSIRQMLMMATCFSESTYRTIKDDDWVSTFFHAAPDHRSGTLFVYDTSSSHVLAALVEKLTGKKMLDYLREKCLDRVDFSKDAYIMEDPRGVSMGGSGLMCTLRDVMKVALLVKDNGKWGEEQLIPEDYIKEAVMKHIDTDPFNAEDENQGYGYFFWRARYGGISMIGMGGQFFVIYPKMDFVFGVMADTQGVNAGSQILRDIFFDTIYDWVKPQKWEPYALGEDNIIPRFYGVARGKADSFLAKREQDKTAVFDQNPMGLKSIRFDFERRKLHFSMKDRDFVIEYGIGEWAEFSFHGSDQKALASAAWRSENRFLLKIQVIGEDLSPVVIEIGFRTDNAVSVRMKSTSEPEILRDFNGFAGGTCGT